MRDMFDVYNQVRAQGLSKALRRNSAQAQQIIDELAQEKADALATKDAWKVHYLALEQERNYLLELLDEQYGGTEHNPARQIASDSIRIPHGPRKGQFIEKRDRIYLGRLKEAISEKASYLGSWKDLIQKIHIFD